RRSPLTYSTQSRSATWRKPVRVVRASLIWCSTYTHTVTDESGWSPSDHGHHSAGLLTPKVHSTEFVPRASGNSRSRSTRSSTIVRTRTVRGSSLSSSARTWTWARSALASWHSTRNRPIRTGPVRSTRTVRHRPPGFHVGSNESEWWKAPVTARFLA